MLPQFLVQNKLLVNSEGFINQHFADLFNTNVFHIQKLVDELTHYKNSLQLWQEVANASNLNYHEYAYDANGALVGRVSKNSEDTLVKIQQPLTKYESVVANGKIILQPVSDPARPSLIRSFFVAGLSAPIYISIQNWTYQNGCYRYQFDNTNSNWYSNIKTTNDDPVQFAFVNDKIFGRLFIGLPYQNQFIRDVDIKIDRQWNPYVHKYDYFCVFYSIKLPDSVFVELY